MSLKPLALSDGRIIHDGDILPVDAKINDLWLCPDNHFWTWDGTRWLSSQVFVCCTGNFLILPTEVGLVPLTQFGHKIFIKSLAAIGEIQGKHDDENFYEIQLVGDSCIGGSFKSRDWLVTSESSKFEERRQINCDLSNVSRKLLTVDASEKGEPGPIFGIFSLEYQLIY